MLPRLLPEKGNPIQEVKENGTKESDVLTEQISPDNVAVMAELIAMKNEKCSSFAEKILSFRAFILSSSFFIRGCA